MFTITPEDIELRKQVIRENNVEIKAQINEKSKELSVQFKLLNKLRINNIRIPNVRCHRSSNYSPRLKVAKSGRIEFDDEKEKRRRGNEWERQILKKRKKFYLKYQKNKNVNKNDYFNRFPSNNKIIKHFVTSYELLYDCKKYKYYKCWIINLTDDKRRFIHKKNRSRKAEHKRNLKEYQDMNKFLDNYLDKKGGNQNEFI